jgi:hypothetical protein
MRRVLILGLMALCLGCGKGDGLNRAAVNGRVTLNGAEIAAGTIAFYPTKGLKGPVAGGAIKNGQYAIGADRGPVVGPNRVEIHASKKSGRKTQAPMADPGVMADETVEAVPEQYNTRSTLVAEVKPGTNMLDYELTTPK